jgi:hypothetical protein
MPIQAHTWPIEWFFPFIFEKYYTHSNSHTVTPKCILFDVALLNFGSNGDF